MPSHDFETTIRITPDADGVHCGECRLCFYRPRPFSADGLTTDSGGTVRCPACLAAEKAYRARQWTDVEQQEARERPERGCIEVAWDAIQKRMGAEASPAPTVAEAMRCPEVRDLIMWLRTQPGCSALARLLEPFEATIGTGWAALDAEKGG